MIKSKTKAYREQALNERNFIRAGLGILTSAKGAEWMVDLDVFSWASKMFWFESAKGYAATNLSGGRKNSKKIYLHKMICPQYVLVDHINRNVRDNRRRNFREGRDINGFNRPHDPSKCASGVRGVHKRGDRWIARFGSSQKKQVWVGTFATVGEAKSALADYTKNTPLAEFYRQ